MTNPNPKGRRDQSMSEKERSVLDIRKDALRDPRDMVKA
jgi:hypothetical protein